MPFPCFNGTTRALRLPAARPAALRCLRLAVPPCADRSCLLGKIDASCRSLGSPGPATPCRSSRSVEMTGPLTFPGDPLVHMPCSQTPAGPTRQASCGESVRPPRLSKSRAPTSGLSGLYHTASALAVYASQRRLPERHARLASVCRPRFDGRGSHPLDPAERFQRCFLHRFLLSRAS